MWKSLTRNSLLIHCLFAALLLIWFGYSGILNQLTLDPYGLHFTRQTDSLAFVHGYLQNGMHFWKPSVLSQWSTDGRAACEFPILYYLTALLSKLFGHPALLLRLITLIIFSFGILSFFRLVRAFLDNTLAAFILVFLLLSSTVVQYYSVLFLPDASALGLTGMAWLCSYRWMLNPKGKNLWLAFALFTLAGLLKVTFFLHPTALTLGILSTWIWKKSSLQLNRSDVIKWLLCFVFAALLIVAWNLYAIGYNAASGDNYFLTKARPIWQMTEKEIQVVWSFMSDYWSNTYFYPSTLHVLLVMFFLFVWKIGRTEWKWKFVSLALILGELIYLLLFYAQFKDHDYYFLLLWSALPIVGMVATKSLLDWIKRKELRVAVATFFLLIMGLSLHYSQKKLKERFEVTTDHFSQPLNPIQVDKTEWQNRIPTDAKILVLGDYTPNGSLVLLNRKGWTTGDITIDESQLALYDVDFFLYLNDSVHNAKGRVVYQKSPLLLVAKP